MEAKESTHALPLASTRILRSHPMAFSHPGVSTETSVTYEILSRSLVENTPAPFFVLNTFYKMGLLNPETYFFEKIFEEKKISILFSIFWTLFFNARITVRYSLSLAK